MHDLAKDRAPLESVGKNNYDILHEKKTVCVGVVSWRHMKEDWQMIGQKKEGGDIVFYFAIPGVPL